SYLARRYLNVPIAVAINTASSIHTSARVKNTLRPLRSTNPLATKTSPSPLSMKFVVNDKVRLRNWGPPGSAYRPLYPDTESSRVHITPPWTRPVRFPSLDDAGRCISAYPSDHYFVVTLIH